MNKNNWAEIFADDEFINQAQTTLGDEERVAYDDVILPDAEWITQAIFLRDGLDLHLKLPDERSLYIENYFAEGQSPDLLLPDGGARITPALLSSFMPNSLTFASDENILGEEIPLKPIGAVELVQGTVSVTHINGESENLSAGVLVYEGDVITTGNNAKINIMFEDRTLFSLGSHARMTLDEMVYDPQSQSGVANMSVLHGDFMFVTGEIAKSDPDNMTVYTPIATIAVRGTIVTGSISLQEGAQFSP